MGLNKLKQVSFEQRQWQTKKKQVDTILLKVFPSLGDSVTLRATPGLQEVLPDAQTDAQVSRNTKQASAIMLYNSQNKALPKVVVVATGVNNPEDYKADLDFLISNLPKGHQLVLVTPYEGDTSQANSTIC